MKFCLIGASGALLQLGLTYLLTEIFKVYYLISMGIAIVTVTLWNYSWSSKWVFKK
ncbi:MAG: GtrA family protein [Alphaproteobacteria bacterium]|nr:GtrA family protein [Alphaproteobacteria bacterium]